MNDLGRRLEVETGPPAPRIVETEWIVGCTGRRRTPAAETASCNVNLAYRGRSAVTWSPAGVAVALAPNLRRDRVSFEGILRDPLHFREAIGALHDVVVSDLRYQPRDRSAHEAYKAEEKRREDELRRVVTKQARAAIHESLPELPESYIRRAGEAIQAARGPRTGRHGRSTPIT